MARIHNAPHHCNCRKQLAKPWHWPDLTCFFRSWLFWMHPLEWLSFNVIAIHPRFVTVYDIFEQIWIVSNISCTMSMQRCFFSKFRYFGTIFAAARFILKTSVKIAWQEPNDMPTSSTCEIRTYVIHEIWFYASVYIHMNSP